ncbi:hypothetical protein Ae505Ps2_3660 [Pseudonocardia sp. Ae505_Ps2]|nr:hypothetical protein Ae505Ps2_6178 [Pseudonocardia sp. Ae505_Ps2]OLM13532.1 hypothetical protein Ae505Ps2_3660 [Pseudonocardia sp. Ae505_Ps2]
MEMGVVVALHHPEWITTEIAPVILVRESGRTDLRPR